jgi:hypothetical protein
MKLILSLLAALLIPVPCIAMSDTQTAYLQGFQAGYNLRALWQDDVAAYNAEASAFNLSLSANLNESDAVAFMLPMAAERIAPVCNLFNASVPIEEMTKA